MRMPTWSVTTAGSKDSGSAPLMKTRSARSRAGPQAARVRQRRVRAARRGTLKINRGWGLVNCGVGNSHAWDRRGTLGVQGPPIDIGGYGDWSWIVGRQVCF